MTREPHAVWVPELRIYLCSECHREAEVGIAGRGSTIHCGGYCEDEKSGHSLVIGQDDGRFYGGVDYFKTAGLPR